MEELEGVESETAGLDLVRDNGFEGGEEGTEESQGEAEGGEVVVSSSCEADSSYHLVEGVSWGVLKVE